MIKKYLIVILLLGILSITNQGNAQSSNQNKIYITGDLGLAVNSSKLEKKAYDSMRLMKPE